MEMNEKREIRWYEILYLVVLVALIAMSVFFMNPHRVGVLDIGRVAREVKMMDRMAMAERQRQEAAYERITAVQKDYNKRVAELNRQHKGAASDAEKQNIQKEIETLQREVQEEVNNTRQEAQRYSNQMLFTFRKRLQPFIDKVAHKRKLDIVLDSNSSVFYTKKSIDITDAVIENSRSFFSPDLPLVDLALILKEQESKQGVPSVPAASATAPATAPAAASAVKKPAKK